MSTVVSGSSFEPDLVGVGENFSVPRLICNRGTLNSKMSSMLDRERDICPRGVEKWRIMLNLDEGREFEVPDDGVVWLHKGGVRMCINGEYIRSSRNLA